MKSWTLLAVLTIAVLPAVAIANDESSAKRTSIPTQMIGAGVFSCGKFEEYKEQRNQDELDLIVEWVWGFMVAFNDRGFFDRQIGQPVSQVSLPDAPTVVLFIAEFCKKDPLSNVMNATAALIHTSGGSIVWHPDDKR